MMAAYLDSFTGLMLCAALCGALLIGGVILLGAAEVAMDLGAGFWRGTQKRTKEPTLKIWIIDDAE